MRLAAQAPARRDLARMFGARICPHCGQVTIYHHLCRSGDIAVLRPAEREDA